MIGHNTSFALTKWAEDIAALHQEIEEHNKEVAQKALKAGRKLNEAKQMVGHGSWSEWLSGIGIGERTAQRYMQLDRHAIISDTVTDLGGIRAALEWLRSIKLPPKGSILIASADGFAPDGDDLMGFIWPDGKGYHVAALDLRPEWPHIKKTKSAIRLDQGEGERAIWFTLWKSCHWRCAEQSFMTVSEKDCAASLAAMVDSFAKGAGDE